MKVRLDNVRIAFCSTLFTRGGSYDRHDCQFIVDPKDKALVKKIDGVIEQVAKEKWKDKADAVLAKLVKEGSVAFLKADYENKDGEVYDGFEGMYAVSAHSKKRPLVIDRDKSPLLESDGRPYAGCIVNGQIDIWAQDNVEFGRRINAELTGVQFVRDGEAFGGGAPAKPSDFDEVDGEDDGDDLV